MEATTNKNESITEIINGSKPVLLDFFADLCAPCKVMKPILEELYRKMGDKIRMLKVDTDRSPVIAEAPQIRDIPTLILLQNGKSLWGHSDVIQAAQ